MEEFVIIKEVRVNRQIRAKVVRVVDEEGKQVGVMSTRDALILAEEQGLDLVEVAPNADPPVCKIMDFGKYKYLQKKKMHEAKKRAHIGSMKEVRLHLKIDKHDLEFKIRKVRELLEDLHRVQVVMFLRGRERKHTDLGIETLNKVWEAVQDVAKLERAPTAEGNRITMLVSPTRELLKKKEEEVKRKEKEDAKSER